MKSNPTKTSETSTKFFTRSITGLAVAASLIVAAGSVSANMSDHDDDLDYEDQIVKVLARGNIAHVEELFHNGLGIDQNIAGDGTPLIIALQNRNHELAEYLVSRGADVNLESTQDGNPLIAAALANDLTMVRYLLDEGAQIDAITRYDETALISASRAGNFKIVKYLVENGADVNLAVNANVRLGKELRSPLNGAKTEEIRRFLINNGAKA